MANFNFTFSEGQDGKFKIGRKPSVLINGAEFKLTQCVTGVWKGADGAIVNKDGAVSVRFLTSLSDKLDDAINLNKLLGRRRIVYNDSGRASVLYDFEQHELLEKFLLNTIGRDADDSRFLKGTAKEIGEKILDFFKDKTFVVEEVPDIFFKEMKDGVEKLVLPFEPVLIIKIKE